jgi:predicted nicotinamide N-methyase
VRGCSEEGKSLKAVDSLAAAESLELSLLLQEHLSAAQAVHTELPDCKGLCLYLLTADFPQHQLSGEEMQAVLQYPAYWAFCWASGVVLARYLLDNPRWVAGKRVLDFGCGSGVAGIAALKAGASQVIACDIDPDARTAAAINATLNGVELEVTGDLESVQTEVDIILVADVLYDRENLPWLSRFIERAPRVLVADSRVRNFEFPGYRKLGQWQSSTIPDLDEFDEFRQVSLYLGQAGQG